MPGVFTAIIFHEISHGFAAYLLGDNTAKNQGRLNLNPLSHIDPLGFLSMLILKFGWAKPVPYNPNNFKNVRSSTFIVALAGPMMNFLFVFLTLIIFKYIPINNIYLLEILRWIFWYNIMLGTFNLLPFPPLDGSKLFISLFPEAIGNIIYKYERYLYAILIILIFSGFIDKILGSILNNLVQYSILFLLS